MIAQHYHIITVQIHFFQEFLEYHSHIFRVKKIIKTLLTETFDYFFTSRRFFGIDHSR